MQLALTVNKVYSQRREIGAKARVIGLCGDVNLVYRCKLSLQGYGKKS
jgi:hypothetical protein